MERRILSSADRGSSIAPLKFSHEFSDDKVTKIGAMHTCPSQGQLRSTYSTGHVHTLRELHEHTAPPPPPPPPPPPHPYVPSHTPSHTHAHTHTHTHTHTEHP